MSALQIDSKIISNEKILKNYHLLKLEVPLNFKEAQPGQFVHIKVGDLEGGAFLRRPFSIHKLIPNKTRASSKYLTLKILYEIKGKGTSLLSKKIAGDILNILGPLGKGFDYTKDNNPHTNIFIAGGMGIAPLVFLIDKLMERKARDKNIVLIGAANKSKILCQDYLAGLVAQVKIATEDGSLGFKGTVLKLFEKKLIPKIDNLKPAQNKNSLNIYACGPKVMLANLAKICMINKLPLQVSLEEFMGCGIGACLGCAIKTKNGYQRVCSDGPVFDAREIVWEF